MKTIVRETKKSCKKPFPAKNTTDFANAAQARITRENLSKATILATSVIAAPITPKLTWETKKNPKMKALKIFLLL